MNFHQIVSGEDRRIRASLLRGLLRVAEIPYTAVMNRRNAAYDRHPEKSSRPGCPVVSVGNITLGGTGKTPMIAWLCRYFLQAGGAAAVLSRGYKSLREGENDEARELAALFPHLIQVQNKDRLAGAEQALAQGADLLLVDDGFQHRRLGRTLDLVLLDALNPFGFRHVFPRGLLREPLTSLRRADYLLLTRADAVSTDSRIAILKEIARIAPQVPLAQVFHSPEMLIDLKGNEHPLSLLKKKKVAAFCGVGNPQGFWHSLSQLEVDLVARKIFPDHHHYKESDLNLVLAEGKQQGAEVFLCTEKDRVKLREMDFASELYAVRGAIRFLDGEANFLKELADRTVHGARGGKEKNAP